jgi:uncharacterized membrane protein
MTYVIAYIAALVIFGVIDILWLTMVGAKLFRDTLGDVLAQDVRMAPAIAFYLLYPLGVVFFAIAPALREASVSTAILNGAMFGLMTYATYDLTNYATLRSWTLNLTIIDLSYGAALTAATAVLGYWIASWFSA